MSYGPEFRDPELYRMMARQPSELREALDAGRGMFPPSDPVIDARLYPDGEPLASRCRRAARAVLPSRTWLGGVCGAVIAAVVSGLIVAWLTAR